MLGARMSDEVIEMLISFNAILSAYLLCIILYMHVLSIICMYVCIHSCVYIYMHT